MKRTKSMTVNPTCESRELALYALNTRCFYKGIEAVEKNLLNKVNKGVYKHEKAIDAFYPLMCEASKSYKKDFGYAFTVNERFNACIECVESFEADNDI